MGNISSTQNYGAQGARPTIHHTPIPEDQVPFPGPQAQFKILQMNVTCMSRMDFSFSAGHAVTTTNIDSYYGTLAAEYDQGFRLATFYKIPGATQMTGMFNPGVTMPFQGIFYRYPSVPPDGSWRLHIEKSMMQINRMFSGIISLRANTGMVSDTSHIMDTIANATSSSGGRLLCIELTGQQAHQGMQMAMQGLGVITGVDVFFEQPLHPNPTLYTYQAISIPITVTYAGFPLMPTAHCDWMGSLGAHLNQGWKLVEIFMDMSQMSNMGQRSIGMIPNQTLNAMWFFEKEAMHVQDPTPKYQGTIIQYDLKIKAGIGGSRASPQWAGIMEQMGQRGWEFACFLELPDVVTRGFTTYLMKILMFFQRRIPAQEPNMAQMTKDAPPAPAFPPSGAGAAPPPPYDDVVQSQKM